MITGRRVLGARYRLEDLVGQGGMAQVFRATDLILDRTVAVKVLASQLTGDRAFVQRFEREARAAARINHPGVVAVFDTGAEGDLHYIVMEFVEGRTLAEELRAGPLSPERALRIAEEVSESLSAAHAKGLVHRDVKPGNVMVTPSGAVKVMDFGIARALASDTITQTAALLGTATYLSPEQAAGDPVDARSDVYSLGVVLYEMLTGRPPFVAESPVAVAGKHLREEPSAPSKLAPALDPGFDAVVLRALAKAPQDRYASAAAMRADLEALQGGTAPAGPMAAATAPVVVDPTAVLPSGAGVLPGTATVPTQVPRGRGRHRVWPALVVLVAMLAALALAAAFLGGGSSPPSAPTHAASATPPSTTTPSPPSVAQATSALQTLLAQGVADGDITSHAADEIGHGVDDATKQFDDGHPDKALEKLDQLPDKVSELADKGEISGGFADQLDQAITDLAAAMQA